ncbi:MAG: hypothetical protein QF662_04285, partial [Phycisphaerae bacterium]|nr:hypothetical protein [Phycisphaerae bacterium]
AEIAIAIVAVAIYAFSQIQVAGILRAQASGEVQQETDRLYKQACVEYLSSRLPEARKNLQALLAINPDDTDAHMLMSRLTLAEGKSQSALRWLKRAHFLDTEGKWHLEFRRSWTAISATSQTPKTPPSESAAKSLVSQ